MYPLDDDDGVLLIRLSVVAVASILGSSGVFLVGGLCLLSLEGTSHEVN